MLFRPRVVSTERRKSADNATRMDQDSFVFVWSIENERRTPMRRIGWNRLHPSLCGWQRTKGERRRRDQNTSGLFRLRVVDRERKENDDDTTRMDEASFVFVRSVQNERKMMTMRPEWMKLHPSLCGRQRTKEERRRRNQNASVLFPLLFVRPIENEKTKNGTIPTFATCSAKGTSGGACRRSIGPRGQRRSGPDQNGQRRPVIIGYGNGRGNGGGHKGEQGVHVKAMYRALLQAFKRHRISGGVVSI